MIHIQLSLWLGVSVLYLGFAGVMGVLLRRVLFGPHHPWEKNIAWGYAILFFLPASIFVGYYPDWTSWSRLVVVVMGLCAVGSGFLQPSWLPANMWRLAFGRRYFAGAMALATLWGISLTIATNAFIPILVATAAVVAGAASLYSAQQIT
jgi:hypothetical protein